MAGHLKRSASSAFEHGSTSDCAIDLDADLDYYTLSPFQQPQPSKIRRSPNAGFSSSSFAPPRGNGYASARGMNTLGYDLVELEDVIGRDPLRPRATFGSGSAGGNNYGYYPNSYDSMLSRNPTKPPAATMTATNHNTFAQDDFGLLDGWDGSNWQGGNDTKNLDFSAGAAMGEDELNKFIMNIQDTAPPPPAAAATFAPNRRKPKPQPMFTPPSEIIDLTDDDVIDLTTDKGNINNTRSGAMSDLQFLGPPRSSFRPPFGSRLPEGIKIIRHPNGGVCILLVPLSLYETMPDGVVYRWNLTLAKFATLTWRQ